MAVLQLTAVHCGPTHLYVLLWDGKGDDTLGVEVGAVHTGGEGRQCQIRFECVTEKVAG